MAKKETKKVRPLSEIAREIHSDWGEKIYYGATPYIMAMMALNYIDDKYMLDDARDIVRYFLANASSWRGDTARRVKAELKSMLK